MIYFDLFFPQTLITELESRDSERGDEKEGTVVGDERAFLHIAGVVSIHINIHIYLVLRI